MLINTPILIVFCVYLLGRFIYLLGLFIYQYIFLSFWIFFHGVVRSLVEMFIDVLDSLFWLYTLCIHIRKLRVTYIRAELCSDPLELNNVAISYEWNESNFWTASSVSECNDQLNDSPCSYAVFLCCSCKVTTAGPVIPSVYRRTNNELSYSVNWRRSPIALRNPTRRRDAR